MPEEYRSILLPQLRAKPVRTASGIAVVAVMSKPHRCPHIATTGERSIITGLLGVEENDSSPECIMNVAACHIHALQLLELNHLHYLSAGNICVYCPGGPDSDFEYSTQSYTGYEPTSMRAIRARYNPYVQARGRVDQLRKLGHSVDKVEFILMGGESMDVEKNGCTASSSTWAEVQNLYVYLILS